MTNIEDIKPEQIENGYTLENGMYICIFCGRKFEIGEMFSFEGRFFDALKTVKSHIEKEHPNRLSEILNCGSKYLSLTENQKELFLLFHSGMSDKEIAKKLSISPSTVRHHRFVFRERAKTAKLYLTAWNIVEENKNRQDTLLPVHKGATMIDERYVITEEESQKILENVFSSLEPLKLKVFSPKEKKKIVILRKVAEQFESEKQYLEKEVNEILKDIYEDYATLRRYLIEYGFMERTTDCRIYWKK